MPKAKLTYKQKEFIKHFVKTKNATKSALVAYEVKDADSARSLGSQVLANLNVRESIDKILARTGYNPESSIQALVDVQEAEVKRVTASEKTTAAVHLLKLSGHYVERSESKKMTLNVDAMQRGDLITLKEKYSKKRSKLPK